MVPIGGLACRCACKRGADLRFGAGLVAGLLAGGVLAGSVGLALADSGVLAPGGMQRWMPFQGHHGRMHGQMHGSAAECAGCYSPVARPEADARVEMRASAFAPSEVRIRVGESVEWVNLDDYGHTVTSDGRAFDSGMIPEGEAWAFRFDEPGVYEYRCVPHSARGDDGSHAGMVGRVVVEG